MTEERISRLEGAYEQVDKRLGDLMQAVAGLRAEIAALRQAMSEQGNALRTEMSEQNSALRTEMSEQNSALRTEMSEQNSALRTEMSEQNGALRTEMTGEQRNFRSEINNRLNTLLVVGGGAWVTTVGLIIGLYLQS